MDLRDQLQATLSGSYMLERELGGGGMSRVFIAEELRLKRKVVVKVLSPELAQGISVDPIFLAGVHERLGELYEESGQPVRAVAHYRAFIEQWKNADPELQPRVAEARRRLAKLAPVEKPR